MGTHSGLPLIQPLSTGRSAPQQKMIEQLTLMLMLVPDKPGLPHQLWRLQFQRDIRLERLQKGLTRVTKDVENTPLIEPSQNSKRKA